MNLLDTKEAAKLLGLKKNTLEIWRCHGRGPIYIKIEDHSVRYSEQDLLDYIQRRKRKSTSEQAI